ncbi:hypothetical protein HUE46_13530 [Flavobacterium columnare]|uniref:hypothetical protein n=1 Tax=Flavobacterium columnare TaxID=996 RepID=UPI000D1C16C4|nr:hypothetical protein [Flavobacterium columnare]MBF6652761.1 hypothetical protein [Flavobacterium columnare]PTD15548.1 hypothetical protein C6N29_14505 [Flavobacterium columnare]QOG90946.1 hypothetical protein HUE41_13530 [Flavobacterium columnare]QOG93600.1 hypothetical protein HUE42_13525 [Flavobacterium columnare]QOG96267.1 hypothetical protein HUE43_13525 [Flavobacterium columnare]
MNSAYFHLLVNHFPIIGLFFGIAILIYGIFKKNPLVLNIAYILFIFSMIMGKISMITGDKAEHFLEKTTDFSHNLIEVHKEKAEIFMKIVYLSGLTSIMGLIAHAKKHPKAYLATLFVLIIGSIGILFSIPVGTSGGKICHTEFYKSQRNININKD